MIHVETTPMDDDATRQYVDAQSCFTAHESARALAESFAGGMVWKTVKDHDYLVRTSRSGAQTSLGRRSEQTERLHATFFTAKRRATAALSGLTGTLERHSRMNRALRVGRVPNLLLELLMAIRTAGLGDSVAVVGNAALYAYETTAGVRFSSELLQHREPQALAGSKHQVALAIADAVLEEGALALLERLDASFQLVDAKRRIVMNSSGVAVEVIIARDLALPVEERWRNGERDLQWLASAPRFSEVVVGKNGRMARMTTVDPRAFVLHKDWLVQQRHPGGPAYVRDIALAEAVERLVADRLPHLTPVTDSGANRL